MKKNAVLTYTVLLLLAVTAVYSNHFHNGFHFDDDHSVVGNPYIRDLKNVPLFFKDGTTSSILPQNQAYRPVVTTSLALDYKLGNGYDLFHFQISTFILFLGQGVLMLIFFSRLLNVASPGKYASYIALFATAWYMLHPAIAETVNYIIARSDVQSTLAVMAGLALYCCSPFCKKTFIYLIPVATGALAKPPAVMFAPLLFFYILFFEEKMSLFDIFKRANLLPTWRAVKKSVPAFILCALMYLLIARLTPKTWQPGGTEPLQYLITQPFVVLHYFATFFWPAGLSADSDWSLLPGIWNIRFFSGCAFILAMLGIGVYTSRTLLLRPISFGILWYFLALIPTSSIIPLGEVLNDHRMFFPFIGLALSVSWAAGLIVMKLAGTAVPVPLKYKTLIALSVLVLFCSCAYGTWKRNEVWHTEESLWFNVTVKSPKNGRGLMNYGLIKLDQGEYTLAEKYFTRALLLVPNYSFLYANMGVLKEKTGDFASAENYYLQGITLGNMYASHYFLYGEFLYRQARLIEAQLMLQKALQLSESYMDPRAPLMKIYAILGEWSQLKNLAVSTLKIAPADEDALMALQESAQKKTRAEIEADRVKSAPTPEKYLTLSLYFYWEGKYGQSIEAAKKALKLKPDYAEAYNNIGSCYNALGQYDKGAEALKMALSIKPGYQLAKNNLQLSVSHTPPTGDLISGRSWTPEEYLGQSLTYYNQRQYELCIAASVSALVLNPNYDLAYNNLCSAYIKLGRWDDAILVGERGLKINPGLELLKNNLAQAELGKKNAAKK